MENIATASSKWRVKPKNITTPCHQSLLKLVSNLTLHLALSRKQNVGSNESCHTMLFSNEDVIESVKCELINSTTEEGYSDIWDFFVIKKDNGVVCLGNQVGIGGFGIF